jgi:hypothetical protein
MFGLESVLSSLTCRDAHRPARLNSTTTGTPEHCVATMECRCGQSLRRLPALSFHPSYWPSSLSPGELLKLIVLSLWTLPCCITENGSVKISSPRVFIDWALEWSSCPILDPWCSAKNGIRYKSKFERGLWGMAVCASSPKYLRHHSWSGTRLCEGGRKGDLLVNVSDSENNVLD